MGVVKIMTFKELVATSKYNKHLVEKLLKAEENIKKLFDLDRNHKDLPQARSAFDNLERIVNEQFKNQKR